MKPSKLPIQAVPVERTVTGASVSSSNGVDPSQLAAIWQGIKQYGPTAICALCKGFC